MSLTMGQATVINIGQYFPSSAVMAYVTTALLGAPAIVSLIVVLLRIRDEDSRLQLEWDTDYHPPNPPTEAPAPKRAA